MAKNKDKIIRFWRRERGRELRKAKRNARAEIRARERQLKAEGKERQLWAERRARARQRRLRALSRARFSLVKIRHRRTHNKAVRSGEFQPYMLNGHPSNITPAVKKIIAIAVTKFGLVVTATTNGNHVRGSNHYPSSNRSGLGEAVDLAGSWSKMVAFQSYSQQRAHKFEEAFGPPNNHYVKYGHLYNGSIPNHFNHNHSTPYP